MSNEKKDTFSAMNLFIYAPIGALYTVKDMLPSIVGMLANRGKSQVTQMQNTVNNTYVLAKSMGQMRVNQAQQEGKKRADQVRQAAEGSLKVVQGVGKQAQTTAQQAASTAGGAARSAQSVATTAAQSAQSIIGSGAGERGVRGETATPTASPPKLAIPNYDTLSAVNVAEKLDGLSREELKAIQAHETANKSRKTIVGKIDNLLGQ